MSKHHPFLRRALPALGVVLAVAALGQGAASAAVTSATAAARPTGKLVPASGTLFGAYVNTGTGWDQAAQKAAITRRESDLGRKHDVLHYYYPFDQTFPTWRESWNLANGRHSMVSWSGAVSTTVNSGALDATINARADAVRAFGQPLFLRYFWEMDGKFNAAKTGTPEQFVASWRRIHDLFVRRGATNAVWVWCPTAYGFSTGQAQRYYPGDAYVDWTCADGYNWAGSTWVSNPTYRSFKDIFAAYYAWGVTRNKPMMVGETGALEGSFGVKAKWVGDARATLKASFPLILAVVWYDTKSGVDDWRANTSTSAYDAYKAMARDPYFRPAH